MFDLADHFGDVFLEKVVVEYLRGDGDGVIQGQAGCEHGGHGVGKFSGAVHDVDLANDGQAELDGAADFHAAFGFYEQLPCDDEGEDNDEEQHPPFGEEVCHGDHHAGHQWELATESFEDLREGRDDLHHDNDEDNDGDADDEDRIGQGAFYFFTVLGAVFVVAVHAGEGVVEGTGQLSCAYGFEEGEWEGFFILFEGACDGASALYVFGGVEKDPLQLLIVGLSCDHFHRAADRHAGFQCNRELRAHECERSRFDAGTSELHVEESGGAACGFYGCNARNDRAFLPDLCHGGILIHGLYDASGFGPVCGQCSIGIGYQSTPPFTKEALSMRFSANRALKNYLNFTMLPLIVNISFWNGHAKKRAFPSFSGSGVLGSRVLSLPAELELFLNVVVVHTGFFGGLWEDFSVHGHLNEAVVHGEGALVGTGEHEALHLWGLAFADQVLNGLGDDHDFGGHDTALAACADEELLAEHGLQGRGELESDLALAGFREDAHDSVDRVDGAVGVERGKHEVTGLGSGECGFNGGEVAHFADEDNVGVLTQDGAEAVGIGLGVGADLALVDDALVRGIHVLDRVLEGDDVLLSRVIDRIEDGGEGR